MALPNSGTLTLNDIQNEFGGTNPIGLSEYYRGGSYVPNSPLTSSIPTSGQISVSNFYGTAKRREISTMLTAPTSDYNLYVNRTPFYVPGVSDISVYINPGVTIGSTSTGGYALLVPSEFSPTDTITIYNNGTIQGAGGSGGAGRDVSFNPLGARSGGSAGSGGGSALYINRPTTIYNNNIIAGGGGGGGGGQSGVISVNTYGGGGGGGGAGFSVSGSGGRGGSAPGPILNRPGTPGQPGTASAGGSGGSGFPGAPPGPIGGPGGPGGPGGGLGSVGSSAVSGFSGGAAGNYIVGNGFVNWAATGTRYGGVA